MHIVTDCPCGQQHEARQAISALYKHKGARMDATWPVTTRDGRFLVPRIFIAMHGMDGGTLADAATRYGFERVALKGCG